VLGVLRRCDEGAGGGRAIGGWALETRALCAGLPKKAAGGGGGPCGTGWFSWGRYGM